jgi:hypothetical protein
MDRGNHYELAFAAYLRHQRLTYVAVDESRRAQMTDGNTIKSLDFIVHGTNGARLLIDIKGRRFPGGTRKSKVWQNWSTEEDIIGLLKWEERFGPGYQGLLVFNYELSADVKLPPGTLDEWTHQERRYLLRAVPARLYRQYKRTRSPKWGTVGLPTAIYRAIVKPISAYTRPQAVPV